MRSVLILFLLCISQGLYAQADILSSGTYVPISFTHIVCSNNDHQIRAFVARDIYGDSGKLVIRGGEDVKIAVNRKKARGFGRAGWVEVIAVSVTAIDGTEIMLNGNDRVTGETDKVRAWVVAIGGMVLLPPIGIVAGFIVKGEDPCLNGIPLVKVVSTTEIKTRQ